MQKLHFSLLTFFFGNLKLFYVIELFIFMSVIKIVLHKGVIMNKLLKISERNKCEMQNLLPSEECTNKLALYFQNFSDQTRIKILSALSLKELCVNDISKLLGINQTTVSHQLKTLKDQDIVEYKREGKILVYRIKSQSVNDMMMFATSVI